MALTAALASDHRVGFHRGRPVPDGLDHELSCPRRSWPGSSPVCRSRSLLASWASCFGVEVADGNTFEKLWSAVSQIGDWNWTATIIGVGCAAADFRDPDISPKLPAALTAVVLASVIVAVLSPDIDLVAEIPQGLPIIRLPNRH